MDRVGQAAGGFFRGQLLVALFVGVASSIGLWAIGLPLAGLFAMLVIVPLVAVAKIVFLFLWSRYVDYGEELTQGSPD
jgi:predicted PurR-regulated permease PerM